MGPFKTAFDLKESVSRIVMHIDLDAFYASCEENRNPKLKGKPVIIGADPKSGKGRGVVSTANYEARKFGIKSAMPISWAYRKCKHGIFLPVDMKYYIEVSERIMKIIRTYSEKFEQTGIDEAFIDATFLKSFESAKHFATKIQKEIYAKERISCSIGIGPNKLIAKIASDFKKPRGITLIKQDEIEMFLSPLKLIKIPGIGPKSNQKLKKLGIETVEELNKKSLDVLKEEFGSSYGSFLYDIARGIDESEVIEGSEVKSIGKMYTFEKDTSDIKKIEYKMNELIEEVYRELKQKNFSFRTITIKIRYKGFETHTKQKSFKMELMLDQIKKESLKLLRPFLEDNQEVRLVGFSLSGLKKKDDWQKTLE